jgi:hypothetical protein
MFPLLMSVMLFWANHICGNIMLFMSLDPVVSLLLWGSALQDTIGSFEYCSTKTVPQGNLSYCKIHPLHSLFKGCTEGHYNLIQVDIGGHPPVPNSNWLILTVFSSTCFSVMGTFLCNCGFCTSGAILKPYTTSRWILVAAHLFQLAYFGSFHVSTSFCTSRAVLGL